MFDGSFLSWRCSGVWHRGTISGTSFRSWIITKFCLCPSCCCVCIWSQYSKHPDMKNKHKYCYLQCSGQALGKWVLIFVTWTANKCSVWSIPVDLFVCNGENCSQRPHSEKTGRWFLLNHSSCPPDNCIGQRTELDSEFSCAHGLASISTDGRLKTGR